MDVVFPELTSFGTVLKYALALEARLAELAEGARALPGGERFADVLAGAARDHAKRGAQLEQLRRERLNEVVLQPVSGMDGTAYLPPTALPAGAAEAAGAFAAAERQAARFYDDAAEVAQNVLSGVERTFRKLADKSRALAAVLGA